MKKYFPDTFSCVGGTFQVHVSFDGLRGLPTPLDGNVSLEQVHPAISNVSLASYEKYRNIGFVMVENLWHPFARYIL
jgi:hypothetical protein